MKYKIVLDILNNKTTIIGEEEKQKFIKAYKRMLKEGFYLAIHKSNREWFASNKFPEKLEKAIIKQDEFLSNIFIEIKE